MRINELIGSLQTFEINKEEAKKGKMKFEKKITFAMTETVPTEQSNVIKEMQEQLALLTQGFNKMAKKQFERNKCSELFKAIQKGKFKNNIESNEPIKEKKQGIQCHDDEETNSESESNDESVSNFVALNESDAFDCESVECNEEEAHDKLLKSYNLMLEKWNLLCDVNSKLSIENDFLKKEVSMLVRQVDGKMIELDEQSKKVEKLEEELRDAQSL
ncbi:hypothetical protein Gotri_002134, partial [Gossypium trilobum]|nr:hypothetical protein [Gossypium trilobum]